MNDKDQEKEQKAISQQQIAIIKRDLTDLLHQSFVNKPFTDDQLFTPKDSTKLV